MENYYEQIVGLYNEKDRQKRGYMFEQLIREIQPWTYKPPISALGNSEQLDAVYEWNDKVFIVEAKAKEKKIMQGSSDWEDFELKVRRRNKAVIGLFLSLYEVDEKIISQCEMMNKEGYRIFVIFGAIWEDLNDNPIGFHLILKYLLINSGINYKATISSVEEVRRWFFRNDEILHRYNDICVKNSSTFLRRFKQDKHEDLYVTRLLDKKIEDYLKNIFPKVLSKTKKVKRIKRSTLNATYEFEREIPPQILIVRDVCGAGKTTYAVENALKFDNYISLSKSASEENIDCVLEEVLQQFGQDYGIAELKEINRPVVFVVDSLDEAQSIPNKNKEIKALISLIPKLNDLSKKYNLYAYPMIIIFTVREEYWREWESLFEGMHVKHLFKIFSEFVGDEFRIALEKYQKTYHYKICNGLSKEDILTLSNPLNLCIFSETHKFEGNIEVNDVFTASVLYNYFENKSGQIHKRGMQGVTPRIFLDICENFLSLCVYKSLRLNRGDFYDSLKKGMPLFTPYEEELLRLYESEQIFRFDEEGLLVIRHMKFFEFLYADYMIQKSKSINDKQEVVRFLDDFISRVNNTKFVDLIEIYNNVKYICSIKKYGTIVQTYLDESNEFVRCKLSDLRCKIALGQAERIDDYDQVVGGKNITDGNLLLEAFFVCSAKCNSPSSDELLALFLKAWKTNKNNIDRWKLLAKLHLYHLLEEKRVMAQIVKSTSWKEWQVYLGYLSQGYDINKFASFMQESDECIIYTLLELGGEWEHVGHLLNICGIMEMQHICN